MCHGLFEHRTDSPVGLCDARQRSLKHTQLSTQSTVSVTSTRTTAHSRRSQHNSSGVHGVGVGVGGKCWQVLIMCLVFRLLYLPVRSSLYIVTKHANLSTAKPMIESPMNKCVSSWHICAVLSTDLGSNQQLIIWVPPIYQQISLSLPAQPVTARPIQTWCYYLLLDNAGNLLLGWRSNHDQCHNTEVTCSIGLSWSEKLHRRYIYFTEVLF